MNDFLQLLEGGSSFLLHSNTPGYLGVDLSDVDAEKAQALKLREARGAVITLIDHDAPAGQSGLKVNDVVMALNGQKVENAEQLRHMLREIPPGRKISIEISREGNLQTMALQLADRRAMEHDVWNKLGNTSEGTTAVPGGLGILPGNGDGSLPGGFHVPLFGSTLKVGALVEPLTSQMAEYMGVPNGLMVKQVARKSEAAAAGLKAFDVILKVGNESISTSSDWERALHANQGKPVQVIVLRDRKPQTLLLQVDSKRRGAVEPGVLLPASLAPGGIAANGQVSGQAGQEEQIAELRKALNPDEDDSADTGGDAADASVKRLLHQLPLDDAAQALQDQLLPSSQGLKPQANAAVAPLAMQPIAPPPLLPLAQPPMLSPQPVGQLSQPRIAPIAQMQQPGLQTTSQRAFQQAQEQMEAVRKSFNQGVQNDQKQMEQMKQRMAEMKVQGFGTAN
jgi:membrane-associated protease RseP (regulator of RpoE activity)